MSIILWLVALLMIMSGMLLIQLFAIRQLVFLFCCLHFPLFVKLSLSSRLISTGTVVIRGGQARFEVNYENSYLLVKNWLQLTS